MTWRKANAKGVPGDNVPRKNFLAIFSFLRWHATCSIIIVMNAKTEHEFVTLCAWCGVLLGVKNEGGKLPAIKSHGICKECKEKFLTGVRESEKLNTVTTS